MNDTSTAILKILKQQDPRPQSESWMTRQLDGVSLSEQRDVTAQLESDGIIQIVRRSGAKSYRVIALTEKGRAL